MKEDPEEVLLAKLGDQRKWDTCYLNNENMETLSI